MFNLCVSNKLEYTNMCANTNQKIPMSRLQINYVKVTCPILLSTDTKHHITESHVVTVECLLTEFTCTY